MKLGAVESIKFKKLKMKLGLPHWQAIGLLEALWMFTARNAPLGDIGKHSNEDIAVHLEWTGDADALVQALTDCRWLDQDAEYRLLVHDWADHLPDWLKGNLKKHKKEPITRDSAKQPKTAGDQPAIATCSEQPPMEATSSLLFSSDLTPPDLTRSNSGSTNGGTWLASPDQNFESWWKVYPRRTGKRDAWPAWQAAVLAICAARSIPDEKAAEWLLKRTQDYRDSPAGQNPISGGDFRPFPAKWLESGKYDDDLTEWAKPNGDGKRINLGSGQVTAGDDNRF